MLSDGRQLREGRARELLMRFTGELLAADTQLYIISVIGRYFSMPRHLVDCRKQKKLKMHGSNCERNPPSSPASQTRQRELTEYPTL